MVLCGHGIVDWKTNRKVTTFADDQGLFQRNALGYWIFRDSSMVKLLLCMPLNWYQLYFDLFRRGLQQAVV